MIEMEASGVNVFERLTRFVRTIFKTNLEIFFEALKLSPNAQGYVSGSITELLLKRKLENEYSCEVKRIREKWEGKKHFSHHGDFYFRRKDSPYWFVLESKGVKSNSEKWHKLYNYGNLKNFLIGHADKIAWVDQTKEIEPQIVAWITSHLPKFLTEYSEPLYEYEEVQKYIASQPKKQTDKSRAIQYLQSHTREEINTLIRGRLQYLMSKVKVLETHFVSGTSGTSLRTQATPRKDEFNLISVDIFLRDKEHRFLFANPQHLDSSGSDANHLQQNYIMGFVFPNADGTSSTLSLTEEWYEDLNDVYETLNSRDCVDEKDMQTDNRNLVIIGDEE